MIKGLAKAPPQSDTVTDYDRAHFKLYLRLLDSVEEGADWREASRILFEIDATRETDLARQIYDAHLSRARWMTTRGYLDLLNKTN